MGRLAGAVLAFMTLARFVMPVCASEPLPFPAGAERQGGPGAVRALTRQIMLKEVELDRINLRFLLEYGRQPRFRPWRYFIARELIDGGNAAGFLAAAIEQSRHFRNPEEISPAVMKGSAVVLLAANILEPVASGFELASNAVTCIKHRRAGIDRKLVCARVIRLHAELDELFRERKRQVEQCAGLDSETKEIFGAEESVLRDIRSFLSAEFVRSQSRPLRRVIDQNLYYFLNCATGILSALSAGVALRAADDERYNGPSLVLLTLAGATLASTPTVSNGTGIIIQRLTARRLGRKLGESDRPDLERLQASIVRLDSLLSAAKGRHLLSSGTALQRLSLYHLARRDFEANLHDEAERLAENDKVALQRWSTGTPIGGAVTANGILGSVAAYRCAQKPVTGNYLEFAGNVSALSGYSTAVLDNIYHRLKAVRYERRLRREGRIPRQRLEQRLAELDRIEGILRGL